MYIYRRMHHPPTENILTPILLRKYKQHVYRAASSKPVLMRIWLRYPLVQNVPYIYICWINGWIIYQTLIQTFDTIRDSIRWIISNLRSKLLNPKAPGSTAGCNIIILIWHCRKLFRQWLATFKRRYDSDSWFVLFQLSRQHRITLWRHEMEIFSALLAICAGYSPVTGEIPA